MDDQNKNKDSEEEFEEKDTELRKSDFDTFFDDLDKAEEEVSSEAYELVAHALSLIKDHYYDDAIEILRQAIGLYSQINKVAEIEALNKKITDIYLEKELYFRKIESESILEIPAVDERNEIYTKAYGLIDAGNKLLAMKKFNEALDNYDEAIKFFQILEAMGEIEEVNKLIEECYNRKAEYLKQAKELQIEEKPELSEEDLKLQRIRIFKETKQHEEEISNKAFGILNKASEFAKIHQYDQSINLYLRALKLFEEINWKEEVKKVKTTIEELEISREKWNAEMAQLRAQEEKKKLEQEKAVELIEKAKMEEKVRIQMQAERLAEITKKTAEEKLFRKKIAELTNKAENLAREYETEKKKAIKKGTLPEKCVYLEIIEIYEDVRNLVAEKGLDDQVTAYSDQIIHYNDLYERDKKLRQIEAQKLKKQKEYEELQKTQREKISDLERERKEAFEQLRTIEHEEELFKKQITEMINRAEKLAREYETEKKKAIKKGILPEECVYPEIIAIYEEVRGLVAEKGWEHQVDVYSNQISHYLDLLEKDGKLRLVEAQKAEKQKEYEELQKAQSKKITDLDLERERIEILEQQRRVEQEEENFKLKIDQMLTQAEKLAREYDLGMKKAIKKGQLLENCAYPEVIAIYEEVRKLVAEKGWKDQVTIYSNQIAHYLDLLEKDSNLRVIEAQKVEKQKEYDESQKAQSKEVSDSELERLKALEQQRIIEQEEEAFRAKIDQMITQAEKLAREYEIEMKKAIKKGQLLEKCAFPDVIAIYEQARNLVLKKGFEKEATVYSNQIRKYSELLEKDNKLRVIEAQKVEKQKEYDESQKAQSKEVSDSELERLKALEQQRIIEQEEEAFRAKIDQMITQAEKLAREYEIEMKKAIKKGQLLEKCAFPDVIAIYEQARNLVLKKGFEKEATVYSNQIKKYSELLEKEKRLHEIEVEKAKKQENFIKMKKRGKDNQIPESDIQRIKEVEVRRKFEQEEQAFEAEIDQLVDIAEKMAREYELTIKRGNFEKECPYPRIIEMYKDIREKVYLRDWTEEAKIYTNQIILYQEKLEKDSKLRELEAKKVIEKQEFEESLKRIDKIEPQKLPEDKEKDQNAKLLDEAMNLINDAENEVKSYELSLKKDILIYKSPYEKALSNYEKARKIFKEVGWVEESNRLLNTINFYKDKKERDDNLREIEKTKLEKAKMEEARVKYIPEHKPFAQEEKVIDFEKLKKEEAQVSEPIFQLINKAEKMSQEYEIRKKEGILNVPSPYLEIIDLYKQAKAQFEKIEWNEEAIQLVNSINYYKEKLESDKKVRDFELHKLKKEEALEEKRKLEAKFAREAEAELLKQKVHALELKRIKNLEYEAKKEQAFNFMDLAKKELKQNHFEKAIRFYQNGEKNFSEINWPEGIRMVNESINLIKKKQEALERERQLLKIKEEEEIKVKAQLEEQIAKAQDLKDMQEEKRKQELIAIQKQQDYERKVSEQAYKLLEDGTELKNLKKFEQAYEKYIMGRDFFEKIGWVHEVSRINNDLLFILKKEMKQVERIKVMQKRKLEEEKEIEVLLREADEKRKEGEKVKKEEKREKRELVMHQKLEEANNIINDLKYNEG
ncbi:MAG: hypothetical protein ACFFFB_05240, partial [Candidatus Heimdallarchaeota archaeon]